VTIRRGFTLIELLVVIAVIGILAAIALISLTGLQRSARDSTRRSNISDYATAVARYYQDNQQYPANGAGGADTIALAGSGTGIFSATSTVLYTTYMPKPLNDPLGGNNCKYVSSGANTTCQYSYYGTAQNFTIFSALETANGSTTAQTFYINDRGSRGYSSNAAGCTGANDTANCP
jgi:prepilin-type N-terminal cleavage/methylation domain-containing protein